MSLPALLNTPESIPLDFILKWPFIPLDFSKTFIDSGCGEPVGGLPREVYIKKRHHQSRCCLFHFFRRIVICALKIRFNVLNQYFVNALVTPTGFKPVTF